MESITTFIHNNPTLIKAVILILGYFVTFMSTSYLIERIVLKGKKGHENDTDASLKVPGKREIRDGYIIGKCENIIILSFILVGEITGLALIFAAKNLARQNDIKENAGFFLTGTIVNFTASLVIAFILKFILQLMP